MMVVQTWDRDGSPIHEGLILSEKLTDDLKSYIYWYFHEQAYHIMGSVSPREIWVMRWMKSVEFFT